jgi:hemolysin activation/secretion protein
MKTYVKSFKFSGNSAFSSETLASLIKPYENQELGINGLKEVASIITKYYRDNGYFVARAYIPAQSLWKTVSSRSLIIEGTYGAFEMKNSSLVETSEVQGFMDHLKGGEISLYHEPRAPNAPHQRSQRCASDQRRSLPRSSSGNQ